MYRHHNSLLQVLLVHFGGPFWAKKDKGAWSIPKGEYLEDEDPLAAAQREFIEETGFPVHGPFLDLGTIKQAGGKYVSAWAFEGDCDPAALVSNLFQMEWPPKSGKMASFPEVDHCRWFSLQEAEDFMQESQKPFLAALQKALYG